MESDNTKQTDKTSLEIKCSDRPASYYENSSVDNREKSPSNNNIAKECKFKDSPTQTHCLNTTVPQNIAKQDIAGKHTPTRNSLRHSRMIVLNRSGYVTQEDIPLFLKHYKLVKSFRILVIILGITLCVLSLWILLWTPNLRSRDNPCWSAFPVLVSGFFGIIFINTCPKIYSNRNIPFWRKAVQYISITTSVVAAAASLVVFLLATIYLITQISLACAPQDNLNTTCICRTTSSEEDVFQSSYHYVDLTCSEVRDVLSVMIIFSCTANALIALLELIYLYLHWASRKIYFYTRVQTHDDSTLKSYKSDR